MPVTIVKKSDEQRRPKQGRSPAYPGIDLKGAIEKARALEAAEGKYAVPMPSAFKAWGYGEKSSGGREARAALRYFGLITVEGDGETGKVKLTENALRVLLDQREDQSGKKALIRELALTPAIHRTLYEQFPDGIKSDGTVEHFLVFDEGYNKSAAAELVDEFKSTADYAGLYKPASTVDKLVDPPEDEKTPPPRVPAIGDFVQVEIGGAYQLEKPARVRAFREHEGQKWAFVEGSESGILVTQLVVVDKQPALNEPPRLPEEKRVIQHGFKEEKNSLDEGEAVLIWPENLSADSVRDLEYWLTGVLKKAKRRAGIKDDEAAN